MSSFSVFTLPGSIPGDLWTKQVAQKKEDNAGWENRAYYRYVLNTNFEFKQFFEREKIMLYC